MTAPTASSDRYAAISQRLIQQAAEELQKGDFLQAGEKVWGAAAHAMKSVAEQRAWNHNSHQRLFDVAAQVADETGRDDVRYIFGSLNIMHENFYEDILTEDRVAQGVEDVRLLTRQLEAIRNQVPEPFVPRTPAQQRRLTRLTSRS
jgi:hypothetical protein